MDSEDKRLQAETAVKTTEQAPSLPSSCLSAVHHHSATIVALLSLLDRRKEELRGQCREVQTEAEKISAALGSRSELLDDLRRLRTAKEAVLDRLRELNPQQAQEALSEYEALFARLQQLVQETRCKAQEWKTALAWRPATPNEEAELVQLELNELKGKVVARKAVIEQLVHQRAFLRDQLDALQERKALLSLSCVAEPSPLPSLPAPSDELEKLRAFAAFKAQTLRELTEKINSMKAAMTRRTTRPGRVSSLCRLTTEHELLRSQIDAKHTALLALPLPAAPAHVSSPLQHQLLERLCQQLSTTLSRHKEHLKYLVQRRIARHAVENEKLRLELKEEQTALMQLERQCSPPRNPPLAEINAELQSLRMNLASERGAFAVILDKKQWSEKLLREAEREAAQTAARGEALQRTLQTLNQQLQSEEDRRTTRELTTEAVRGECEDLKAKSKKTESNLRATVERIETLKASLSVLELQKARLARVSSSAVSESPIAFNHVKS